MNASQLFEYEAGVGRKSVEPRADFRHHSAQYGMHKAPSDWRHHK